MGDGEVLRSPGNDLAVYVHGELWLRLEPHPLGPVVTYAIHPDEVPALEVAGDPDEVAVPPEMA